jgi:hypothetical protein
MDCTTLLPATKAAFVPILSPPAPARPPRPPRSKVLVVLHPDGWIEVYGDDHVDARVVQRLDIGDETPATATLLDEYIIGAVPRCYRSLYFANKLRATGTVEKVTPEQQLDTIYKLSMLRGLRAMREGRR